MTDPSAVIEALRRAGRMIATAESLTGGALVARLVDVPGASDVVAGGAVCYSYAAKHRVLGVDAAELERTGAVTGSIARAMAEGALALYDCDIALATTGVAGPGPDERDTPAGTVFLALARSNGRTLVRELDLDGDRAEVRAATVLHSLQLLADNLH